MKYEFLDPVVDLFEAVPAWQATLLLLGLSLGVAFLLEFVVLRALLRYTSRTETQYDYIVVGELRLPLVLTGGLTGIYLLTQIPSVSESLLLAPGQLDTFFGKPSLSVILLAWAVAANRVVNRLVDLATAESLVLDSPKPRMRFRSLGESALEYELLCWVRSPVRVNKARHRLNRAIYAALNDAGIEIPFPQREMHVRGIDPVGDTPVAVTGSDRIPADDVDHDGR